MGFCEFPTHFLVLIQAAQSTGLNHAVSCGRDMLAAVSNPNLSRSLRNRLKLSDSALVRFSWASRAAHRTVISLTPGEARLEEA